MKFGLKGSNKKKKAPPEEEDQEETDLPIWVWRKLKP